MHVTCKRVKVYTFSLSLVALYQCDYCKFGESAGKYAPNLQNVYMYVDIFL